MSPQAPASLLAAAAVVLGCRLPPPAAALALVLPCSRPLPPALAQALLLSASLCVLPVVLPYGRLRHAVLPQGRTTDGMLGLPPRPRIPVSLHGRGSRARMGPIPRCSGFAGGLLGGLGVGCVCTTACVCVCLCVRQPGWDAAAWCLPGSPVLQVGPLANWGFSSWCVQKPNPTQHPRGRGCPRQDTPGPSTGTPRRWVPGLGRVCCRGAWLSPPRTAPGLPGPSSHP